MKTNPSTQSHRGPVPMHQPRDGHAPGRDFHGASVIGADGDEIPITECMVQSALDDLDAVWHRARQRCRARRD